MTPYVLYNSSKHINLTRNSSSCTTSSVRKPEHVHREIYPDACEKRTTVPDHCNAKCYAETSSAVAHHCCFHCVTVSEPWSRAYSWKTLHRLVHMHFEFEIRENSCIILNSKIKLKPRKRERKSEQGEKQRLGSANATDGISSKNHYDPLCHCHCCRWDAFVYNWRFRHHAHDMHSTYCTHTSKRLPCGRTDSAATCERSEWVYYMHPRMRSPSRNSLRWMRNPCTMNK